MTAGGKYENLTRFLLSNGQVRVTLSWNELHQLLGGLPQCAGDRTFWGNSWRRHSAHGWLSAGYVVEHPCRDSTSPFSTIPCAPGSPVPAAGSDA